MHKALIMSATALMLNAMAPTATLAEETDIIDRPDFKSATGIFDIDALEALGRVSEPRVSPDGKRVLFGVSYESVPQNKSNRDLYVMNIDGTGVTRITKTAQSENSAVWIDNGTRIAFVYAEKGSSPQLWVMNADGTERHAATNIEGGIEGFLFSPDQSKVVLISTVKYNRTAADIYPDLPKATGRVIDDLMYKHWDSWVTEIPHPFIGSFDGQTVTDLKDIMEGEPYEAPMRPFGGVESFAWSPDSKILVYTSRKKTGMEYALSTNSDLYAYNLTTGTTTNLTEGMMGYDTNPAFSPDGRYMAWLSMERDGYEADKNRLFIRDNATGQKTYLTSDWDYTIEEFAWNPNGKNIWFIAYHQGVAPIFNMEIATHKVTTVAEGLYDYTSLAPVDNKTIVTMRHSMLRPNEIYRIGPKTKKGVKEDVALTDINGDIFAQLTMPTIEAKKVPTTDGKEMLTWVIYPPKFDASHKYPAILYCQGGPQSAVSQFWSYRWNFALMASNGYIMIAPNRRGVPGFGTEWEEQISKDYPGQNMRDYLSAVDYMKANEPAIDPARIGATGASYGGFSVYWLAGNHDKRFAALLAHAGIFNTEAQYLETEEMWFANWDMGGAFWDKDNAIAQRTFATSPHRFVDRWDTPIMISHGEKDYRILASQGMAAFNAAKMRGIPAEMVIFPDENHWILKPQNAVMWQRLFFRWFDRWLKPTK
ncbi:MAG: S9 family peptidase [Muribaculaceae bacterium]|nr:S9 family peptidase [Bacteroidales bacterium]MDY6186819.1 S9 family peptidase [Muribaculaceae bacterium]